MNELINCRTNSHNKEELSPYEVVIMNVLANSFLFFFICDLEVEPHNKLKVTCLLCVRLLYLFIIKAAVGRKPKTTEFDVE